MKRLSGNHRCSGRRACMLLALLCANVAVADGDTVSQELFSKVSRGESTEYRQLGDLYLSSLCKPHPADEKIAIGWYALGALSGDDKALRALADVYSMSDQAASLTLYEAFLRKAADAGNADAMWGLSRLLVSRERARSDRLLEAAANKGHPDARFLMAKRKLEGPTEPGERASVVNALRNAAFDGSRLAISYLAKIYEEGALVPPQRAESVAWLELQTGGDAESPRAQHLAQMRSSLSPDERRKACDLIAEATKSHEAVARAISTGNRVDPTSLLVHCAVNVKDSDVSDGCIEDARLRDIGLSADE